MGEDYNLIYGTAVADLPVSGDVYMDSIGFPLHNLFGDYQATGSTPTSNTTVAAASAAGATSFTVGAIGSIVIGSVLQFGNATLSTAPTENLVVSNVAGSVVTFASTPLRFNHSATAAVAIVTAPFTHTFSLLNVPSTPIGTNVDGQPPTHTITYHDGLAGTYGARQYAYWCCSGIDFKMNVEQLFMHDTKGTSILGVLAGSAPANTQSSVPAVADWNFKVGVGGPASGGTLLNNVEDATVSVARALKNKFGLNGQQAPYVIARLGLGITGKLSFMSQDESPLLQMLNASAPTQLQIVMTQGAGANLISCTFNCQNAQYETVEPSEPDVMQYDVAFRGLMNSTNAGASGGMSPGNIILQNAVGSY